jgi:antitoxin VapB
VITNPPVGGASTDCVAQIDQSNKKASVQELLAIVDSAASHVRRPYRDHGDLLYGDDGLPK